MFEETDETIDETTNLDRALEVAATAARISVVVIATYKAYGAVKRWRNRRNDEAQTEADAIIEAAA